MAIIQITDYNKCCGCGVCQSVCNQNAILLQPSKEGFLYPVIDENLCVECGLCIKSCPINVCPESENKVFERQVYACKNHNHDILYKSSSGGVFFEIASSVIKEGGVVYGCAFTPECEAKHMRVSTIAELYSIMGSKYVQSNTSGIWEQVKKDLKENKRVVFSGCGCQIAALRSFLKKDYDNLLLIDMICMGVPSPLVFKKHLTDLEQKFNSKIQHTTLSFRNKIYGAHTLSLSMSFQNGQFYYEPMYVDAYVKNFHARLFLRQSCHSCSYKKSERESDITMSDFYGIEKTGWPITTEGGLSMVIVHSAKGAEMFKKIKNHFEYYQTTMNIAKEVQPMLTKSCMPSHYRDCFFDDLLKAEDKTLQQIVNSYSPIPLKLKIRSKMKKITIIRKIVQSLKCSK